MKTLRKYDGEGASTSTSPHPNMIESNPATDLPRRRSKLLNTLSISDPIPNGPEHFDAAAFAAHTLSSPQNLAAVLDHTLLKPDATRTQVLQLCHEAAEHRFACAMVNPPWVAVAAAPLKATATPVAVVIGFPPAAPL